MRTAAVFFFYILFLSVSFAFATSGGSKDAKSPKNDLIIIYKEGKVVKVDGANIEKSIATQGDEILQIEGSNNIVYAKGGLKSIVINGANNEVYVDRIHTVKIEGVNNLVQYKLSPTKEGKPTVSTKGGKNDILKAK
ncbi:DUF3060 domain-containing protein [Sphingobacterium oryzagri]|uniref:DUF3060 domain-containing protein n=1 Tax=Sphingobacterium oryzagri TaxID=3025669 RepID=A0ABY7WRJ8_9SPHI|nr:DUF3060 domain-containing protein [Sphingobacterium sp. KACC 22765]WDF69929.1 DUF3060 domain-containing protein [Sphingobacterium sp. KACC 22765]